MKIIDSHAHLMDEMYDKDREEVIKRCLENDVELLVNIGFDKKSSSEAVKYANEYNWMYATIGIHPDECEKDELDISFLKELAKNKKVVAIGEIGLDYHYLKSNDENQSQIIKNNQQKHFIEQIQLANELSLPVVIHSRDADMDMLKILKENKIEKGFVMHCFSSSIEVAKEILKLNGYISFAGTLTFKNAKNLKDVAKIVPVEKIFYETDCPYLSPEPFRGERNEPKNVLETAKKIAEIKSKSLEVIIEIINSNIKNLYKIKSNI